MNAEVATITLSGVSVVFVGSCRDESDQLCTDGLLPYRSPLHNTDASTRLNITSVVDTTHTFNTSVSTKLSVHSFLFSLFWFAPASIFSFLMRLVIINTIIASVASRTVYPDNYHVGYTDRWNDQGDVMMGRGQGDLAHGQAYIPEDYYEPHYNIPSSMNITTAFNVTTPGVNATVAINGTIAVDTDGAFSFNGTFTGNGTLSDWIARNIFQQNIPLEEALSGWFMRQANNTVFGDVANWIASSSVGRWWFQSPMKAAMSKADALRTAHDEYSDDLHMVLAFPMRADQVLSAFGRPVGLVRPMEQFCTLLMDSLTNNNRYTDSRFVARVVDLVRQKETILEKSMMILSAEVSPWVRQQFADAFVTELRYAITEIQTLTSVSQFY